MTQETTALKKLDRYEKFDYEKYLRKPLEVDRTDPKFHNILRQKLIECAKRYIGTPYSKKFLQPTDPYYGSPLFLDCCGLVRQIISDLKEDFGFELGRWNQAYQFDTLPHDVKPEEMKPGDLIFYSGRYYDRKRRRHAHDMVHVEIFIGFNNDSGLQTIAARRREGLIQIFDDYRFKSNTYYNVKHYFKSIDVWLQGICRSYCEKHPWKEIDGWWRQKYSLFADEMEDSEEQIPLKNNRETKLIYIGKGNNDKLLRSFFENEKWKIMNRYDNLSTNYFFKWVCSASEIDYINFRESEQIVNHLQNSRIIASKIGLWQISKEPFFKNFQNYLPKAFRLDIHEEYQNFLNEKGNGIWVYKPILHLRGKGMKIISDFNRFKQDLIEKIKQNTLKVSSAGNEIKPSVSSSKQKNQKSIIKAPKNQNKLNNNFGKKKIGSFSSLKKESIEEEYEFKYRNINLNSILQKYIEKPLLIDGKKLQLRFFVLIASSKPYLVLFHHGYIKISLEKFKIEKDIEEKKKRFAHFLNFNVQRKHSLYEKEKEKTCANLDFFENFLMETKKLSLNEIENIYNRIKTLLSSIFNYFKEKIDRKKGLFELYGCDFIVDENLNPYLIDINSNPSLTIENNTHLEFFPLLLKKVIETVLMINEKNQEEIKGFFSDKLNKNKINGFDVLCNEEINYNYSDN